MCSIYLCVRIANVSERTKKKININFSSKMTEIHLN